MCSFGTVGGEKSHVLQIFLCDDATFPFFFFSFLSLSSSPRSWQNGGMKLFF